MLLLPADIVEKYPSLPRDEIFDAVEIAVIQTVQTLYDLPAGATITDEGIAVTVYRPDRQDEVDLSKFRRRAKRLLLDAIELELMKRQACSESDFYRTIRGAIFPGTITQIEGDGSLKVMIQFNDVLTPIAIHADCPVRQQPPHERGVYRPGETMHFMILSCLPVSNGRHAKVRIIASRNARELPSRLIGQLTGLTGIRCTKRIPGGYSRIVTRYPLPKTAVNQVGKELREHLDVICPLHPDRPFTYTRRAQ